MHKEERGIRMPFIQPIIRCELDPTKPVQEICDVIIAVLAYHSNNEDLILWELSEAITKRRQELKGAEKREQSILQPDPDNKNQG